MSEFSNLNANTAIYEAIRQIAYHRFIRPDTGALRNTERISGYVVKYHDNSEDELYGTVDVQEYNMNEANAQATEKGIPVGLHQGVFLSALQDNDRGTFIIPYLYSDVVIATDPVSLREYVVAYSHADTIRLDAHNQVVVGVTETEEFKLTEDSPDVDELEPTGVHAHTTYTPTSIFSVAGKSDKKEEQSSLEITADKIEALRDKATVLLNADKVHVQYGDKTQLIADAQQLLEKYGANEIVIKQDGVFLGSGDAIEPAVLGNQLADLMSDWLGALSSMMTPTMMGPQAPANVAQFVQLQAKINSFKAATSGFLSKIVKVK